MVVVEVRQGAWGEETRRGEEKRGEEEEEKEDEKDEKEEDEEEKEDEEEEDEEEATDIKSNNPHLAGGEKVKKEDAGARKAKRSQKKLWLRRVEK